MKLSQNRTPLTAMAGLSDEEIVWLKECGIRTWEEYCAYAQTYREVKFAGSDSFRSILGDDKYESIVNTKIGRRYYGYVISEANLNKMKASYCDAFAKKGAIDKIIGDLSHDELPHEVRLQGSMPPIRDQGMRGTCTAFASVALCEFAENCNVQLSPQFLYWACKRRDGSPYEDGTSLDTVQEALYEDGICEEVFWPYNSAPKNDEDGNLDAGQGPAPENAIKNALDHKLVCRALSPNSVRQYRKVLAEGKPVVIGVTTFDSWTRNRMTEETGYVPMPYMQKNENGEWVLLEEPMGGHAMCIVGYVDNASFPGGGYFIVRNSWGQGWASECEEGAGHALMPYRYIAWFTNSAFTISEQVDKGGSILKTESILFETLPPNLRPFARILDHEARDYRGVLLPKGTCVLSLQQAGSPMVEYKSENTNTEEYREILFTSQFPNKSNWSEKQLATYDSVLRHKQEFCAKIDENLSERNLIFKPFPDFKFSWNLFQVMGAKRICSTSTVMDFSEDLFKALLSDALPSGNIDLMHVPSMWSMAMKATVSAKIRKISSFSLLNNTIYVVEVFATPFKIDSNTGLCQFTQQTTRLINIVRACALTALKGKEKGEFVFYTIGTGLPLDVDAAGIREGTSSVVISGTKEDGTWDVRRPGYLTGQSSYRDFCDKLMPLTEEDVVSAVKTYVDDVSKSSFSSGKVTAEEIVEHIHTSKDDKYCGFPAFRQTAVIRAMIKLQSNAPGKYAVCSDTRYKQDIFIIPASEVQKGDIPYKPPKWIINLLIYHSIHFLGLMICSALFIGKAELEEKMGWGQSFILRVVLAASTMCISGLIQSRLNRMLTPVEKD